MLRLAPAHYHCTGCGDCCRGWDVPLEPGEADAFRGQAAALIPADRLKVAIGRASQAGQTVETLAGSAGHCAVLTEDQCCLIHAAHGADAKPRACRIFPFTFVATPTGVRVGLSFACPAVVDADGPLLEAQRSDIEALYTSAVAGTRYLLQTGESIALSATQRLSWPDAVQLLDALAAPFADAEPIPFVRRVCLAGAICALVQARLDDRLPFAEALASATAEAGALVDEALADPPEVDRLSRALFRTLLKSTEPGRASAAGRVGGMMASLFGSGVVRLRGGAKPEVAWRDAERVPAGLGPDGEALIARWLHGAIEAVTFFGDAAFGLPLAGGLDLRVLSAAVVAFLSRAFAAAAGRDRVAHDDVKRALRQLDAGVTHRSTMPGGFGRALAATASLDLLREQLGGG